MSWYDLAGVESEFVLGSFATVIRNVYGYAFGERLNTDERTGLIKRLLSALSQIGTSPLELDSLDEAALRVLSEKGFIDLEPSIKSAVLLLDEERGRSILLGGRNHVKIRALLPGLALEDALDMAIAPERLLDSAFELAYSEELGYLTDDLTFLGSAVSFSLLLHLPASRGSDICGTARHFIEIKGLPGDLFLLTSPPFPGITEKEQCERLIIAKDRLIDSERTARAALRGSIRADDITDVDISSQAPSDKAAPINCEPRSSIELADLAMRAYGILSNARIMTFEEFMPLWSDLRLGAVSGLPGLPSPEEVGNLLISALPSCLPPESDPSIARAELLRRRAARKGQSDFAQGR